MNDKSKLKETLALASDKTEIKNSQFSDSKQGHVFKNNGYWFKMAYIADVVSKKNAGFGILLFH